MKKVSYIIPCYRSEKTIKTVVEEIKEAMNKLENYSFEVILINDSSPDGTAGAIEEIVRENDNVLGIDMTKNFGQHAALMAGFHFATGDYVICLDDDGQTPPSEAYKLIEKLEEGYDAVYARYAHKKHSSFRNFGSQLNEFMAEKMLGKPHDLFVSSYFGITSTILEEILRYNNPFPYVIGLVLRSTSKICNVEVNHKERTVGNSGYSLGKLIALWMNGFTSFSVKPLRIATVTGVTTALAGFLFFIYVLVVKFSHNPNTPLGWTSVMAVVLLIGGMNLMVLGMIGEYIGRMYICINNSPQYVIRRLIGSRDKIDKEET